MTGTVTLGGIPHPYTITPIGASSIHVDSDGITRTIQHYQISSNVQTGDGFATVDRIVDLTVTPLFQFMIFSDDDLEILPGPSMTLGGRVHANGNLYVGSGGTLTADTEYFRATGDILRKRKNDNTEATGDVNIKVKGESTYVNMDNAHDAEYTDWTNHALSTWKGTVQDGAHGVREIAAPDIKTIKAFKPDGTKGFFHENADLVIVDSNAYDGDGNPVSLPPGTITTKNMYDAREGVNIRLSEVNVGLLNSSGQFPANGFIVRVPHRCFGHASKRYPAHERQRDPSPAHGRQRGSRLRARRLQHREQEGRRGDRGCREPALELLERHEEPLERPPHRFEHDLQHCGRVRKRPDP